MKIKNVKIWPIAFVTILIVIGLAAANDIATNAHKENKAVPVKTTQVQKSDDKSPVESVAPVATAEPSPAPETVYEKPAPARSATPTVQAPPAPSIPGNTYPGNLASSGLDTIVDDYGYYNRECVSYVAYKLAQHGQYVPVWWGDANKWINKASAAGIGIGTGPTVGSVAISVSGKYGHAAYVEKVFGDGTIQVSQYNVNGNGTYSVATVPASWYTYIHF